MMPPARRSSRTVVSGLLLSAATTCVVWTLLRVVIWIDVGPHNAGLGNTPVVFLLGLVFDLATLAFVLSPLLLVVAAVPSRLRSKRWYLLLRWTYVWFACAAVLLIAAGEFLFWREFSARFNFFAVDYLIYRREVIGDIRESYPVGFIIFGIALAALAVTLLLYRRFSLSTAPRSARFRWALLVAAVILPLGSAALVSTDQMQATGNAYADELVGNGVYSFVAAARRNELDYDKFYRVMPTGEANSVLAAAGVRRTAMAALPALAISQPRPLLSRPILRRPRNIVLVSIESMSAEFLGSFGNKENLTPNLDRLAKGGILFDHFFATGTRTVRGLEALSTGIPPPPGQSIVRRLGNDHLVTVGGLWRKAAMPFPSSTEAMACSTT